MSIKGMQQRLTQVGVIRLGEKVPTGGKDRNGNPKYRPAKLATFRLTSPSRQLIETAAGLFGGEVRDWADGPSGPEFQVITTSTELPVYVLPQRIDPNLELWGNRHKIRFCDGETERLRNTACICEAAARIRYQTAGIPWPDDGKFAREKDDCKPTTRLSVALADMPDGQWKVESHGWNAAAELPTAASMYLAMAQKPVPALLKLVQRDEPKLVILPGGEEKVESRKFAVPVLDFGGLFTNRQALTAGGVDAAVAKALTAGGTGRQAIAASPAPDAPTVANDGGGQPARVDFYALAKLARDADTIRKLWAQAVKVGALDDALAVHLKARAAALEPDPAAGSAQPPPVDVVDAEVEPDPDTVWHAILRTGKEMHGWNLTAAEGKYRERMGHDPGDELATGWKLTEFLTALKAREVA